MRPETVTEFQIEQWEQSRLDQADHSSDAMTRLLPNFQPPDNKEMFYAGCWLEEQLEMLGHPREVVKQVCGSQGQYQFFGPTMGKNPWEVAQDCLEMFQAGTLNLDSEKLALELNNEWLPKVLGIKAMPPERTLIIQECYEMNSQFIENGNLEIPHAVVVMKDGSRAVLALAMRGDKVSKLIYDVIKQQIDAGAREICFVIDRFCKENQGTTHSSLLSIHYYDGAIWQFGIAEYDADHVEPICWNNKFWNEALINEGAGCLGGIRVNKTGEAPRPPKLATIEQFRNTENLLREDPKNTNRVVEYLKSEGFKSREINIMIHSILVKVESEPQL